MSEQSFELDQASELPSGDRLTLEDLNRIGTEDKAYDAWIDYVVRDLSGVRSALLTVDENTTGRLAPVAFWPVDIQNAHALGDLVDESVLSNSSVMMPLEQEGHYGFAYPVFVDEQLKAVFAVHVSLHSPALIEQTIERIEWLCLWLSARFVQRNSANQAAQIKRLRLSLDGYLSVSSVTEWHEAAHKWVDSLQKHFQCERVSVATVRKDRVGQLVISGSSDHEHKTLLVKSIKAAMQEACDQKRHLVIPRLDDSDYQITQNSEKLSELNQNGALLSLPLIRDDVIYGMVLLERTAASPFSAGDIEFLESVTALVGLTLEEKRLANQGVFAFLRAKLKTQLARLFGAGYLKRKLFALGLIALIAFLSVAKGDYTVNGNVELEPRMVRVVSAPFDGYLKRSSVRAGDKLTEGEVLLEMEDRDLRLEKIKWLSQVAQEEKQYNEAIASYDRAEASIFSAKIAQSRAALDTVESKLERSIVKVPFDALVLSGDLSKRVGGSISRGEELFQVSPLDAYRLVVYVSEYKIQDVSIGQSGHVLFSSLAEQDYPIHVEALTPVTTTRDGGTFYRVEARIDDVSQDFRPGLVGVARIKVDERLLIDIWTHDFRQWMAVQLWSFWG